MLESLKKWASGWVAFILIGLLIISVGFLGITDYISGGSSGRAIATVGEREIGEIEFRRAFTNEINALSRQAGQRITYEQARAVGLDSRVLSQLIGSTAVEAHAEGLDLALSDTTIARGLKEDPAFQSGGRFDPQLLQRIQRELGVSEEGLIDLRRKDELRNQITTAFLRAAVIPDTMVSALNAWRGETRVVSHFSIDRSKLARPEEPTDEKLKEVYDSNLSRYMTPERRDLEILSLSVADLKKRAEITDEDVKQAYEQTKDQYEVAEERRIEQIAFDDKAAAEKALEELKAGKDFLEVAKDLGKSAEDISLGQLTRKEMIDGKIADKAFALAKDEISGVVEGEFTTAIVRVTDIKPGKEPSFDEVKDKVRDELATEWARNALRDYYRQVDDLRGEGRPLKDIASELSLTYLNPKGASRGNVTADNTPAVLLPDANQMINAGFRAEVGLESEPVQLSDGGYAWVDVTRITQPEQKPFDAVKEEVKSFHLAQRRREILNDAARDFAKRVKDGEDFAKVAEEAGGTVATTAAIGRSTIPDGLSQGAVTQAFALRDGEIGNAETADGQTRTIFKVDKINPAPPPTEETAEKLREELRQQVRTDSLAAYVSGLQKRFGVDINQQNFRRAVGLDEG